LSGREKSVAPRPSDNLRRALVLLTLALAAVLVASCANNRRKPVYSVRGQVLFQGRPASEMFVYFRPTDPNDPDPIIAYGQVDAAGWFSLSTYIARDGAPAGDYVVTFEWPEQGGPTKEDFQGPDRLQGRYKDAKTSKFHIRVEKKPNDVGSFTLD
jgi:hypothetical protein